MELTFNKTGELYVAEFKADKEFSLHIERMNGLGSIKMQQNGAEGGKYADVEDFETRNNTKPVIEYDSGAFVAPKWIRIESSVLPTYAAITTDGDVVEIKSQAKVVEISSNGTTSVEPDAGFSYLSKVDVKVDVPQSGEGGGESGGDMVTYVTAPTDELGITLLSQIALTSKVSTKGKTIIMTEGGLCFYTGMDIPFEYIAFSIYNNGKVYNEAGEWITFSDRIKEIETSGMTSFQYITEEEFYNLES